MAEQLAELPFYLVAHLQLSLLALLVGGVLSVPLGVLATRLPMLEHAVLGVASAVQTIPSLALLALMVPVLAALGMTSIGFLPAFIALSLYSTLPILRNTVTGLSGVDPALLEAAQGVGMSPSQSLFRVELPVALPVIIAGVRTATVWTVGAATLATPVGAASLGNYIFSGLQTRNVSAVLIGCLSSAALALLLDGLVRLLLFGAERRRPRVMATAGALLLALCAVAGSSFARSESVEQDAPLVIGAKTFTEQYILSEALAAWLTEKAHESTTIRSSLGSTVAFDALQSGEIDAYVDYSGTLWATIMKRTGVPADRTSMLKEIARYLEERHGVVLVGALGFENAYALATRASLARELGLKTIADLSGHDKSLVIGGDYEFFGRPEWKAIRQRYGLSFREQRSMDPSIMYQAVANGAVDVVSAFSSDGRIAAHDLLVLKDNHRAIPPYDAVILASARLAREHPAALEALRALSGRIDPDRMRRLNLAVDQDGRTPRSVAAELVLSWLGGS